MKSNDEIKSIWLNIFKWFANVRFSSWGFIFVGINSAIAFTQLLAEAFGFNFLTNPRTSGAFLSIAIISAILVAWYRDVYE